MSIGIIKRLLPPLGTGLIETERGDIPFRRTRLQGLDYACLRQGQRVEYTIQRGGGMLLRRPLCGL